MQNIKLMREQRADVLIRAKKIVEKAELETRDMTSSESTQVASLRHEADGRMVEITKAETEERQVIEAAGGASSTSKWIDRRTGKEVRTYGPGQRTSDHVNRAGDLSFGKALRGIVTGDWNGAEAEAREMGTTPGPSGGYLVPAPISSEVIDLARNMAVCTKAGALIVPMDSKTLSIAAIDEDPATEWKIELAPASGSTVVLREVLLTAKTLFCGPIVASQELMMDAPNGAATIEMAIAGAMATALDKAALLGAANGPTGLVNESDVQEIPNIGAIADYSDFSAAYALLQGSNTDVSKNSFVYNPSVSGTIDALTAEDSGQPLNGPASFVASQKFVTNQIGNELNGDETVVIGGDFSQMIIGMRLALTVDSQTVSDDAFEKYAVEIRAALRADIQLARPDQFIQMTGITGYTTPSP